MRLRERWDRFIDRIVDSLEPDELAMRAERRAAARMRPHKGQRFWTERDRNLAPQVGLSADSESPVGPSGAIGTVLANVIRSIRRA